MAVPELMRILLDEANLGWDQAWDLTQRTLAYTNHTLLPEALEKWPVAWFELLLPRHLEIIYEINRRFLDDVRGRFPGDDGRVRPRQPDRGRRRQARSAWRTWRSSARTAPTAWRRFTPSCSATTTVKDFAEMFPERFNNKTNGVTPRRWLLLANPAAGGGDHRGDRRRLDHRSRPARQAASRWPTMPASATRFATAKRRAKIRLRRLAEGRRRHRRSIRIRSSTARSSASTSTSGNCSTRCASSCSTTGCGTTPT